MSKRIARGPLARGSLLPDRAIPIHIGPQPCRSFTNEGTKCRNPAKYYDTCNPDRFYCATHARRDLTDEC